MTLHCLSDRYTNLIAVSYRCVSGNSGLYLSDRYIKLIQVTLACPSGYTRLCYTGIWESFMLHITVDGSQYASSDLSHLLSVLVHRNSFEAACYLGYLICYTARRRGVEWGRRREEKGPRARKRGSTDACFCVEVAEACLAEMCDHWLAWRVKKEKKNLPILTTTSNIMSS